MKGLTSWRSLRSHGARPPHFIPLRYTHETRAEHGASKIAMGKDHIMSLAGPPALFIYEVQGLCESALGCPGICMPLRLETLVDEYWVRPSIDSTRIALTD